MKTKGILSRSILLLCLLTFILNNEVKAKEIFIAVNGNDNHTGLSVNEPLKTVSKAISIADEGDIIYVNGIINISEEVSATGIDLTPIPQLTFEGNQETESGFTGGGITSIFTLSGKERSYTFRHLSFLEGNTAAQKGALLSIEQANAIFEKCNFISTEASNSKGTLFIGENASTSFLNSVFSSNKAKEGGACYIENCKEVTFKNSTISDCTTSKDGGGLYITETSSDKIIMSHVIIENSLVAGNISEESNGGAIYYNNPNKENSILLSIINSTLWKNQVIGRKYGGAIYIDNGKEDSLLELINCTMVENTTAGSSRNGAGIYCRATQQMPKKILNCIMESNTGGTGNQNQTGDIVLSYSWKGEEDLIIYNSFVSHAVHSATKELTFSLSHRNYLNYDLENLAGLVENTEEYVRSQGSIPVYSNSPALRHGKAAFLQEKKSTVDQNGNTRLFENGKCAAGSVEVAIPANLTGDSYHYDHILIYGQSLSTGHQAYPVLSAENVEGTYMIGDQIWINYGNTTFDELNPLVGTICNSDKNGNNIRNRDAGTIAECPLFGAVNHIRLMDKDKNKRIIATSCGTSGMNIEELSPECTYRSLYNDFTNSLIYANRIVKKSNSTLACPAIYFMQGEWNYQQYGNGLTADSRPTADKEEYKSLMIKLKNNMQHDVEDYYDQQEKPLFITYQVGAQYTKGRQLAIGMAQLEASNQYPDVIMAGPVYQMTDRGGHLDSNGYRWYGELLGKVYHKTKVLGEDFKPLQPREIFRSKEDKKKITIKFLVPQLPLVFDTNTTEKKDSYGFEVYHNNRKIAITGLAIEEDCVVITCNEELTGTVEVVYGGESNQGHGNLRDSDDSHPAFFPYVNLDEKDSDGAYIFSRDEHETRLLPANQPKDEKGVVIFGEKYPLYNFSVAFYYKLDEGIDIYEVPDIDSYPTSIATEEIEGTHPTIWTEGKQLFIKTNDEQSCQVRIHSPEGNLTKELKVPDSDRINSYDLSDLSSGIYLITVISKREKRTVKVVLR